MRIQLLTCLLAGLSSALPVAAATCPGTVVLQDSFNSVNPALNLTPSDSAKFAIEGGKASIAILKPAFARTELYSGFRYGDANICVTVATPATDTSEKQDAGIAFWADGFTTYYTFEISTAGMFSVAQRLSSGQWNYLVHLTASPAIVPGTGKTNTVRVLTKGNKATFFVNDQQVGTIDGTPPAGGGMAGFIGDSSSQFSGSDTFDFTSFAVAIP